MTALYLSPKPGQKKPIDKLPQPVSSNRMDALGRKVMQSLRRFAATCYNQMACMYRGKRRVRSDQVEDEKDEKSPATVLGTCTAINLLDI